MKPPSPQRLSYEDLRTRADQFLAENWPEATIPINVDRILDARMEVDVIPVPGIKHLCGVDGFLARCGTAVYVDESTAENVPNRYRFTLAHEIGHIVLHEQLFRAADFHSPAEWLRFQQSIPEEDYGWYEYQAYCFAGLILVPREALRHAVEREVAHAGIQGFRLNLEDPAHRPFVTNRVAREFRVSESVIQKRGKYDRLWSDE